MIILTRLGGHEMTVNPDLIERAEPTPDTVITMVDGHKLVVAESLAELIARVRHWRASVAAEAFRLSRHEPDEAADAADISDISSLLTQESRAGEAGRPDMAQVLRMPHREG